MSLPANRSQDSAGVAPEKAEPPFVLALDVGTSSLRAMLFDAQGRAIHGLAMQISHQMRTTADGGVEADAQAMVERAVQAIDGLLALAGRLADGIAAVALDTFWHSLLGVDATGGAITPVYTWADTRAADQAQALKMMLDEESVHARTGCVFHSTYPPAKLRWVAECQPDVFRRVSCWMTFGEYLYLNLFGQIACSISMASGSGLFDQHRCCWDDEMLDAVNISRDQLAPLVDRQDALHGLVAAYAGRWPAITTWAVAVSTPIA
jgi:gluconokinase